MYLRSTIATAAVLFAAPFAFADTITAQAPATSVLLYQQGVQIEREIIIEGPAGVHDLVVSGLPASITNGVYWLDSVENITFGAMRIATGRPPVSPLDEDATITAARDELLGHEETLHSLESQIASQHDILNANRAQIAALERMTNGDVQRDVADIEALVALTGKQSLQLSEAARIAERAVFEMRAEVDMAQLAVGEAQQALDALLVPDADHTVLTAQIEKLTDDPITVNLMSLSHQAGWEPHYVVDVTSGGETLALTRQAKLHQATGEDWQGVNVVLSTAPALGVAVPGHLYPKVRRIFDAEKGIYSNSTAPELRSAESDMDVAALASAPTLELETSVQTRVGQSVEFAHAMPVSMRHGADAVQIELGQSELEATLFAKVLPSAQGIAFVAADLINTSDAIIPAGTALVRIDGAFNGAMHMPQLAMGQEAEIDLGPLYAMTVTREGPKVLEGDSGVISRRNVEVTEITYEVLNLGADIWDVRVRDALFASEQEDLIIDTETTLDFETDSLDGDLGVTEWRFALEGGEGQSFTVRQTLKWPEAQMISPR